MISTDPRLELAGTAASADEARHVIKSTNPDVLTLDVEMPGMDGIEFLSHLMRLRPMPVVMLSSRMRRNDPQAQRARALGAAACLSKPTIPTPEVLERLCDSIVAAARHEDGAEHERWAKSDKIILIGASTGGVTALESILPCFPADGPPIVIAQHMPHAFLNRFIERLDRQLDRCVDFAADGERLRAGQVRLARAETMQTGLTWHSGAWHVQSIRRGRDDVFCPSVDVLFGSAAPWGHQVGAMILTGLGNDGAKGLLMLRRNGARTLGQSERTCAVYGMPAAALAMDAVDEELDLAAMPSRMAHLLFGGEAAP